MISSKLRHKLNLKIKKEIGFELSADFHETTDGITKFTIEYLTNPFPFLNQKLRSGDSIQLINRIGKQDLLKFYSGKKLIKTCCISYLMDLGYFSLEDGTKIIIDFLPKEVKLYFIYGPSSMSELILWFALESSTCTNLFRIIEEVKLTNVVKTNKHG